MPSDFDSASAALRAVLLPALDQLFGPDQIGAIALALRTDRSGRHSPEPDSPCRPARSGIYASVRIHAEALTGVIVDNAAAHSSQRT
jgi:hypothetical protein